MDLITVFPHVRQSEHGPLPENGCDKHARRFRSVEGAQSTYVSNMLNDGESSSECLTSECLKGQDVELAQSTQRASYELAPRDSIGPNPVKKNPADTIPFRNEQKSQYDGVLKPLTNQRHTKKRGLANGNGEGLLKNQPSVRRPKKKMRPSGASRPSLTLWVLSLLAAVIWMRVFFVEQQPVMKMESLEINSIRFAETPVTSYHQEKSRQ